MANRQIKPFNENDNQHLNGHHHDFPFFHHGHYKPFYNDDRDYNTNVPSYYDYLAQFQKLLQSLIDNVNKLLKQDVQVKETDSIKPKKTGDWLEDDSIITLSNELKICAHKLDTFSFSGKYYTITKQLSNSLKVDSDGVYSPNYSEVLSDIFDKMNKTKQDLDDVNKDLTDLINDTNKKLDNEINKLKDGLIKELTNQNNKQAKQIEKLQQGLEKLVNNLNASGAISGLSKDADGNLTFDLTSNLAHGNINLYSESTSNYIKTSKNIVENSLMGGLNG